MSKVLLVDDDESQRLTLGALLEDEGFEVEVAASFAEGRARIDDAAGGYALVILDQHLGDGLGSALVPLVRARLPGAAVALVSGSLGEQAEEAASADAVIAKGTAFPDLLAIVRAVLARVAPG